MRPILLALLPLVLISCATQSGHTWNAIDGNGVPLAQGRAQCIDTAQRTTADVRSIKERMTDNFQVFTTCMAQRGY
ncbi:MAG TPA: hypothetical protein VMC10_17955 [Stellaceae bacterium]|nr:hypothetical protein [Stellaceae bacterium]